MKQMTETQRALWAPIIARARRKLGPPPAKPSHRRAEEKSVAGGDPSCIDALRAVLYGACGGCGQALEVPDPILVVPYVRRDRLVDFRSWHPACAIAAGIDGAAS